MMLGAAAPQEVAALLPSGGSRDLSESCLYCVPQFIGNDAEIGALSNPPILARLGPSHLLAGAGPAHKRPLTPDLQTAVAFIAEDVVNGVVAPAGSPRRRRISAIQRLDDGPNPRARGVPFEDGLDDRGGRVVDLDAVPQSSGVSLRVPLAARVGDGG